MVKPGGRWVGAHFDSEHCQRLEQLCTRTRRTPSEVLRTLVRCATAEDRPPFRFEEPLPWEQTGDEQVA